MRAGRKALEGERMNYQPGAIEPAPKRCRNEWSHEMDATLTVLAGEGLSGGAIACALGMTRNAIIGRARRMGITLHGRPAVGGWKTRPRPLPSAPRPKPAPKAVAPVAPVSVAPEPLLKPLWELEPTDCKWPYGEENYRFCGHARHGR